MGMPTCARKVKFKGARAPRIDLQKHENFVGKFHQNFEGRKSNWEKDGLNNFMIVLLFLWLCLRLKPTHALKDGT